MPYNLSISLTKSNATILILPPHNHPKETEHKNFIYSYTPFTVCNPFDQNSKTQRKTLKYCSFFSGYGHISPSTATGRAITIIYAIFGIPMFLILLADFGKLFTRCIKFVWAFVRRVYYTGSCRKVRKTAPVQVYADLSLIFFFSCNNQISFLFLIFTFFV